MSLISLYTYGKQAFVLGSKITITKELAENDTEMVFLWVNGDNQRKAFNFKNNAVFQPMRSSSLQSGCAMCGCHLDALLGLEIKSIRWPNASILSFVK